MASNNKIFACEVMREEVSHLLDARGGAGNYDVEWLEMGLHEKPEKLNAELAKRIAACAGKGYDAILLLFGLCSRATAGLMPPNDSMLVIPRIHDCISIFLGSARKYMAEHAAEAGTYWFARGFLHRSDGRPSEFSGLGAAGEFTREDGSRATVEEIRAEFVEKYGEDNAEYLMETLVESWKKNYRRAVFMDWDLNPDREKDNLFVRNYAAQNNWRFETRPVDLGLAAKLLDGAWSEEEFLVVRPGETIIATNDADAMRTGRDS